MRYPYHVFCWLLLSLLFASTAPAQPLGPLNATPDPRTSVLGSVRTAAAGDPTAWGSNPATIADSATIGAFLSNRNAPWIEGEIGYSEIGMWWSNPSYGAVSINYSHLGLGEVQQVFQNGQLGAIVRSYDDLLSVTIASPSIEGFRVGATVKQFTTSTLAVFGNDSGFSSNLPVYGSGVWLDVGATYQLPLTLHGNAEGPLCFGVAVRDLGGDMTYDEPSIQTPIATWLNLGAALTIPFPEFEGAIGVGVGTSLQLTSVDGLSAPTSGDRQNQFDAGLQLQAYGLSLRLGLHRQTVDDPYAEQSTLSPRYGFGVNLPLRQLGINAPLILDFDYGLLPLNARASFTTEQNVHALQLRASFLL